MVVEKASLAKAGGSKEGAKNWSQDPAPSLPSCTSRGRALPCQLCRLLSAQVAENDQTLQPGNWPWGLPPGSLLAWARDCFLLWELGNQGPGPRAATG